MDTSESKAMTVLILTDGSWHKSIEGSKVPERLRSFLQTLRGPGPLDVADKIGFEFVHFGDGAESVDFLRRMAKDLQEFA